MTEALLKKVFGIDFLDWYCEVFLPNRPEEKEKIRQSPLEQKPLAYQELLKFLIPFVHTKKTKDESI